MPRGSLKKTIIFLLQYLYGPDADLRPPRLNGVGLQEECRGARGHHRGPPGPRGDFAPFDSLMIVHGVGARGRLRGPPGRPWRPRGAPGRILSRSVGMVGTTRNVTDSPVGDIGPAGGPKGLRPIRLPDDPTCRGSVWEALGVPEEAVVAQKSSLGRWGGRGVGNMTELQQCHYINDSRQ